MVYLNGRFYLLRRLSVEFTFANGKKQNFHTVQFTKKQNIKILQGIKIRGGFPDKEIIV